MAGEHAGRPVGKAKSRNAKSRNAGEVTRLSLIDLRVLLRSVDKRDLFLERHLAEQFVNTRVARDDGNGLRERERCGDSKERGPKQAVHG